MQPQLDLQDVIAAQQRTIDLHERTLEQQLRIIAQQLNQIETQRTQIEQLEHTLETLRSARSETVSTGDLLPAPELAMLTLLANSAYDALLVLDENAQIIAINDKAQQLFDVPDAIGRTLATVTDLPELEMMVMDALVNKTEETFEEQIPIADQMYRVNIRITHRSGQTLIGLALQDITRLVRLNRARRDMVANISHELATPITKIQLIIDSLFHEQEKPKRKESINSLRIIASEVESLKWIVQEMADLSMIESGQAIMRMVEVPLLELVDETIERLSDQSAAKELHLSHSIPPEIRVLCDRDLARRVLINLVHNAIKWSLHNGTITLNAMPGEDEVTISIEDQGPGVPDDQRERIFERFYQVDASRSKGEGTGLGLAICKHIVEAHGGRIWAEGNSRRQGGYFAFTLLNAGARNNE